MVWQPGALFILTRLNAYDNGYLILPVVLVGITVTLFALPTATLQIFRGYRRLVYNMLGQNGSDKRHQNEMSDVTL
jgi:hypothetical protein